MNQERTIEEIKSHRYPALPEAEKYRVVRLDYTQDFEASDCSTILVIKHTDSGKKKSLRFSNSRFNDDLFTSLIDATGLYLMDTSHYGWGKEQRIEVGDWDGGPPIFWAESVQVEDI